MSEKLTILEGSSDSEVEFQVNKSYADSYNVWRNKEELQKYKDLKREDDDSDTSSESEEEVPELDEEFCRAISLIKGRDPRLYDKNFELFKDKEVKKEKKVKDKPMFMKDYERNLVLERGGRSSDEDEHIPSVGPTYDEQQKQLKKSFKVNAYEDDDGDDEDDGDDGGLLQVKAKTDNIEEKDEGDCLKWLKGEKDEVSEDVKKDMSYLRNYWNDPNLDEGEKFLRDFILNKTYLEKDNAETLTYEEITSGQLSEDEKEVERQETFEHKYNFRFEEPDQEFIKRYPRTVGNSLRKFDNRRKLKREDKTERRRREREQRQEELKQLKALKRKEIEDKFLKLKEVSGHDEMNLNESDMDSDFDPDKHDKKMLEMFNDDYYGVEEVQKPEFPYDEELDSENWNAWTGEKVASDDNEVEDDNNVGLHENCEISDQPGCSTNSKEDFEKEMIEATLPTRKSKKKSLFAKVISQAKPIYDPDGKSFDDYLDEYYKLDYEDIIGDMPVRYKYRKVVPNDFGLTVDEILTADDRELNRWCSVKKTCQYRNDDEEMYDVHAFKAKSQNTSKKEKVLTSLYAPKDTDNELNNVEHENEKYISSKATNHSFISSQDEMATEDVIKSNSNDNIEHKTNQGSFTEHKKKSKKRKRKEKLQNSHISTDSKVVDDEVRNVDFDSNRNSLELSESVLYNADRDHQNKLQEQEHKEKYLTSEEILIGEVTKSNNDNSGYEASNASFTQSNGNKKKSRKRKQKEKLQNSHISTDSKIMDDKVKNVDSDSNRNSSELIGSEISNLESSKSPKTKVHANDILDSEINGNKDNVQKKKKLRTSKHDSLSTMNDSALSVDSNFVLESSPQEIAAKKKKKKRKKGISDEAATNRFQQNNSKSRKFKSNVSGDKRLGLSDERLAAYGINPKKFKNKIIYSKK